ncbi:putative 3-octaprenyl-4-hydroxybenzoate carboxy- lyase (chromatophore) [Paulinella micropora]|uniref:3-octaprenyl-4-hydroxybenzoate carboxy-lyase n=1 Tax=Paulinella micropora TaxID=1928728 RepID=A0A1L5YD10_9EUKA|nr:putative 3-octaprenyl-4-hydroxybenzoate carboxy- lyase [Paulinella micropora]AQX45358.1 putative 3-octaprenyl-4-hydroxybenzoate carboxy- lyase [Paulinella micropora]BBL86578.1 putative 3-octaprenyl-4-hydroxybenzoate carboxy- lyase [Paulinella micropora]
MSSIVLAASGASGQPLAERALQLLLASGEEVDFVISRGAMAVWQAEQGVSIPGNPISQETFWRSRLDSTNGILRCHRWNDQAAAIASGSHKTRGMVILPCSMGTVGRISSGVALGLIERCADVHLKEGRPLIIAPREMPWNLIHLKNLTTLAEAGARITPPIPAWYQQPKTLDDMIDFIVIRILDVLGLELGNLNRWEGPRKHTKQ